MRSHGLKLRSFLAFCLLFSAAATSSDIPCGGCPPPTVPVRPETGFWFDRDEPGTGFMFEVQGGILGGAYFGYDSDGRPEWYLLSGALEGTQVSDRGEILQLEATALRFADGSCLGCLYRAPSAPTAAASVEIQFLQRNLARYRVNGQQWLWLQTLTFGSDTSNPFPMTTNYPIPELGGQWVVVFKNGLRDELVAHSAYALTISENLAIEGEELVTHSVSYYYETTPEPLVVGSLSCALVFSVEPICEFALVELPHGDRRPSSTRFLFPVGNLADARFKGESANGETIEGFRLGYE